MGLLRTFIAADIPPSIQQSIQQVTNSLRKSIGDSSVKWIPAHNLHLTLKFIGDTSPSNVEAVKQAIRSQADSFPAFDLPISGPGSFPNSKRVRVLFIGTQPPAELEALHRGIESACARLGYESESRPFSPHLTIGRVREHASFADREQIRKALDGITIDSLGIARVDSVQLYKSELKPTGAVYTKLFSAPLQQRGEN